MRNCRSTTAEALICRWLQQSERLRSGRAKIRRAPPRDWTCRCGGCLVGGARKGQPGRMLFQMPMSRGSRDGEIVELLRIYGQTRKQLSEAWRFPEGLCGDFSLNFDVEDDKPEIWSCWGQLAETCGIWGFSRDHGSRLQRLTSWCWPTEPFPPVPRHVDLSTSAVISFKYLCVMLAIAQPKLFFIFNNIINNALRRGRWPPRVSYGLGLSGVDPILESAPKTGSASRDENRTNRVRKTWIYTNIYIYIIYFFKLKT